MRSAAVDFSRTIESTFYTVVIPVIHNSKMWYIIDPFTCDVWIVLLSSIPIYLLTMALANYFFGRWADWNSVTNFVIRNVLFQSFTPGNYRNAYQRILIYTWAFSMMTLVYSYSGNLTSMLAKPKLRAPIKTFEELLGQNEVSWAIKKGSFAEFDFSTAPSGSVKKRIFEDAKIIPPLTRGCLVSKLEKHFGSVCSRGEIIALTSRDYSATGKCNYYLLEDRITLGTGIAVLALQVSWTIFFWLL